jgi:hypothetical protein
MKLLSPKMIMVPITRKIHVILSKCENVIEKIQINILSFLNLKIFTTMKNKYKKGISDPFCFLRKKSFDFQKIENHVVTFLYLFWFGKKNLNV